MKYQLFFLYLHGINLKRYDMKGRPKFKVGDEVCFDWKGATKAGVIWTVDKYGTFDDPSDVSYDIFVKKENMLYKHFTEKLVRKAPKV